MTDEPIPKPDEPAPTDPFEAELVAYLDGELDAETATKVESRLAQDPVARRKAAEFQKTFDLLDFLPRPEPSPNFTSRTLERLPVVAPTPGPQPTTAGHDRTEARPASAPEPGTSPSLSVPVALSTGPRPTVTPARPLRRMPWVAWTLVAACTFGLVGYAVSMAFRADPPQPTVSPVEDLAIADYRVVENLSLYAAVDDIEFARELAAPDLFGSDPAVNFEWKLPAVEPEKPAAPAFAKQAQVFRSLPTTRQEALRELDQQLGNLDAPTRDRLVRVLEIYAAWVEQLPEAQRKVVFSATDGKKRAEEVRRLRNDQWVESLPEPQRVELRKLPTQQQADRILKWKEEDAARREEWAFVQKYAPDILDNKTPWPFETPTRQKLVVDHMRAAYRTDDDARCRFTATELLRYRTALSTAERTGTWVAWYGYGKVSYDLARKYDVYPEPLTGEPVTRIDQLPPTVVRHFKNGAGLRATQDKDGKWPEYALAVHNYAMVTKGERIPIGALGPARPSEFREPLRSFVTTELTKTLTPFEKKELTGSEGQWPRYPQEVVKLSRQHDLSAPGLMLPGSPREWDKLYGAPRFPGGGFGSPRRP